MKTQTNHAEVFLRESVNGHELPFWQLMRTGLLLARLDRAGPLHLEVRTQYPTIAKARIDGEVVLETNPILTTGLHFLRAAGLAWTPKGLSQKPEDDFHVSEEEHFLQELGVEPDREPAPVLPYIGEPGGVLKIRLGYFRFDNGKPYEFASDELIYKLSSEQAFLRAVAENAHRIVIEEDPEMAKHGHLCGMNNTFDPQHNH